MDANKVVGFRLRRMSAMKKGEGQVITGWMNKMQAAIAHLALADMTAEMHRKMAAPGTAKRQAT